MTRSKFILSIVNMLATILILIAVAFSWFSLTEQSNVSNVFLQVDSAVVESYEMYYYTEQKVYRFTIEEGFLEYNSLTNSWVEPTVSQEDQDVGFFSGVLKRPYDLLISQNNINTNIFIELRMNKRTGDDFSLLLTGVANPAFASEALAIFQPTNPYFLSQFLLIQSAASDAFINEQDGANLFFSLKSLFSTTNEFNQPLYPMYSFYDVSSNYQSSVALGQYEFPMESNSLRIFVNLMYYDQKITEVINDVSGSGGMLEPIRFFEDFGLNIRRMVVVE